MRAAHESGPPLRQGALHCLTQFLVEPAPHAVTFVDPDLSQRAGSNSERISLMWRRVESGAGGATLLGGVGSVAAPMNGYPKVFNIEVDPQEEHNIGAMYDWVLGPLLKIVEEYKASLVKNLTAPAANMTRF
jgi:hypothetical protein